MLALPNLPPKTFLLPSLALGSRLRELLRNPAGGSSEIHRRAHICRGLSLVHAELSLVLGSFRPESLAAWHPFTTPLQIRCVLWGAGGGVAPGLTHAPAHLEEASASPSPTSHILAIRQRSKRGRQLRSKNHSHVLL